MVHRHYRSDQPIFDLSDTMVVDAVTRNGSALSLPTARRPTASPCRPTLSANYSVTVTTMACRPIRVSEV